MKGRKLFRVVTLACALAASGLAANAANAADLDFDFKISQGDVGTSFATLSLQEFAPGTTTFTLDTALSGGQGNPGIVELRFGCNLQNCGNVTFIPTTTGVTIESNGVQAGYNFDYVARFDPSVYSGNTPLTFTATESPNVFLESTSGAGPNSFAMIQLTGGSEVIDGQNITSGFYVAVVPEPSTYALMLAGIGLVGFAIRRKRKELPRHSLSLGLA